MSEDNKDNKEFEFIKEQVLPKKHKKFKRWLIPLLMTVFMAIIFGLVASLTFCIAEPRLYRLLHKDEENPFVIPSPSPGGNNGKEDEDDPKNEPGKNPDDEGETNEDDPSSGEEPDPDGAGDPDETDKDKEPDPVVETIVGDIEDYLAIYNDIKKLSEDTRKSILTVSCIIDGKDWFGNPIEQRIYTAGIVVENDGTNLKLLVSLDRVKDAGSIRIEINDSTSISAVLHDYESELNLAIISVNIADIPTKFLGDITVARIGESHTLTAGTPVIALGSPNGYPESIDIGIVTSKGSVVSITDNELDLFNTNMVFNKDSDGIIINFRGEIIGIITRTLKKDMNKELSTVLGISKAKSYIDRMTIQKPRVYCGIIAENLPQVAMAEYNVTRGVYIYEVKKDSPSFNAGLMSGDIILNVGDRIVSNMNNFYNAISEHEPGTPVTFTIRRTSGNADKDIDIKVVMGEKAQ